MTSHRKFVWDGWLLLMELDGLNSDAVLRKYTWGLDVAGLGGTINSRETAGGIGGLLAAYDTNGTPGTGDDRTFVYCYDGNGNVGQLIETTAGGNYGTIAVRYEYDPYGGRLKPPAEGEYMQPWRFSTKQWDDETGLGYWGYRYYSASLGRWLSRDPIHDVGAAMLTEAWPGRAGARIWRAEVSNAYLYGRNRSTAFVDPLGLLLYGPPGSGGPASQSSTQPTTCCRKRTDQQCCADAMAAGLHNVDGKPTHGGVVCCDGRKVACVWHRSEGDWLSDWEKKNSGYKQAVTIYDFCVEMHEREHFKDLGQCPDKCPQLYRPGVHPLQFDEAECRAYKKSTACLQTMRSLCGYGENAYNCEYLIDYLIKVHQEKTKEHCGKAGNTRE